MGLRLRIAAAIGLTFLITACVCFLVLFPFEQSRQEMVQTIVEHSVHAMAGQRTDALANELYMGHDQATKLIVSKMAEVRGVLAVGVYDRQGRLLTATADPILGMVSTDPERFDENGYAVQRVQLWSSPALLYERPIEAIGQRLGYLVLYYDLTRLDQFGNDAVFIFVSLLGAIFLTMTIVLWVLLSGGVIKPVHTLSEAMRRVQEGRLGEQVDLDMGNEIGDAARAFNAMSSENARMVRALDDMNKTLEERVIRRTAELTDVNEQLRKEIAERKRTEAELVKARDEARAASRAKSDFLSAMSHEIRTPLNAIQGMAQTLQDAALEPENRRQLEVLSSAGESLLALINDILDLSKMESGRITLERVPFALGELVDEACMLFRETAGAKGVDLLCSVEPGLEGGFYGDPHRIRQIIVNLLGNAVKFTDAGAVSLTVSSSPPDWWPGGTPLQRHHDDARTMYVAVSDTGEGIPGEHLKAIFEKFTQLDASTTRKYGGTGLGLNIADGLSRVMGGRLRVQSEPGRGSDFCFSLTLQPLPEGERLPVSETPLDPASLPPASVLLVEDSEYNTLVVRAFLKNTRLELECAANGEEALEMLREKRYDAVIMDMQMPVMDGFTATGKLRELERERGAHTPVIAMTAYALKGDEERCLDAGCDLYLSKPVRRDGLLRALSSVLGGGDAPAAEPPGSEPEAAAAPIGVVIEDPELRAMAPRYLASVGADVQQVADALESEDYQAIREVCHRLKGEGAAMGFAPVTELAATMHAAARERDAEEVRRAAEDLQEYLSRVVVA